MMSSTRPLRGRRQKLRQRIEHLSHEVSVLDGVANQHLAENATEMNKSIQRLRASLVQGDLAEKQTELAPLVAQEEALGPVKVGGTDWAARRNRFVGTVLKGTITQIGTRRLLLATALLALVAIG